MKYLYLQSIEVDVEIALELMVISDKYLEVELVKLCEEVLLGNIDLRNCVGTLQKADALGFEKLRETSFEFVIKNIKLIDIESLEKLNKELLKEIFVEIVKKANARSLDPLFDIGINIF